MEIAVKLHFIPKNQISHKNPFYEMSFSLFGI